MAVKGSAGGGHGTCGRGEDSEVRTINSHLGDGVNQLVVGDIDQELKMVQKVGPENGVLDVCNKEDPPKVH